MLHYVNNKEIINNDYNNNDNNNIRNVEEGSSSGSIPYSEQTYLQIPASSF